MPGSKRNIFSATANSLPAYRTVRPEAKKLHFAYNAALAAINTAKVAMARDDKYKGMSLASYSMLMHNMFIYISKNYRSVRHQT